MTSEGKNSTAGLLKLLYSSVLSFETRENMEKEIVMNQLVCNLVRILKTGCNITGEQACSMIGF